MTNRKVQPLLVKGKRIDLRFPQMADAEEFIHQSRKSVRFHRNLVSPALDVAAFEKYVKRNETDTNRLFLICEKEHGAIVGVTNMSQIFQGVFKNAYLGYYLFQDFVGRGYMTEGLNLTLQYAFRSLRLHRLEANIQPHNFASINLVKRCGFTKEGFSRKYLKIGGKWCDHERWAIICEDWDIDEKLIND